MQALASSSYPPMRGPSPPVVENLEALTCPGRPRSLRFRGQSHTLLDKGLFFGCPRTARRSGQARRPHLRAPYRSVRSRAACRTIPFLTTATGCHPDHGRRTQEPLFHNAGNSLGDQTMRGTLRLFPAVHLCRPLRSKNAWRGSNSSARQRSVDGAACTRNSCSSQDASLGLAIWV